MQKVKQQNSVMLQYKTALNKLFTTGQIRRILCTSSDTKVHWSPDNIASAIFLRCTSPKPYRYLRSSNCPLLRMSTLRSWISNFKVKQGILKSVISLMKTKLCNTQEKERLCFLFL